MSFFGLTALGAGNVFERLRTVPQVFHEVPDEKFRAVFHKYVLNGSVLAAELQVPPDEDMMMRCDLLPALRDILERPADPTEMDIFLSNFNADGSATISLQEFMKSAAMLKEQSRSPVSATSYVSNARFREHRGQHRRAEVDPQQCFVKPITTSQEIGWHGRTPKQAPGQFGAPYHPLLSTEVTKNEGRSVNEYYGIDS